MKILFLQWKFPDLQYTVPLIVLQQLHDTSRVASVHLWSPATCVRCVRQQLEEYILELMSQQQSVGRAAYEIQPYGTGEERDREEATGSVIYYSKFCEDRAGLPPSASGGPEGTLEIPHYAQVTYPPISLPPVCVCVCACYYKARPLVC